MKFKKLLALILSAVMALSILAGCGKNNNYSNIAVRVFDQLMEGEAEMNFEGDADLLKALQDAISQGNGDLSTIRNLVVQALGAKNVFSFSVSGAGAAKDGQHGIAVCRVTGKTPEEAARNAFAQVKDVLESLLANGTYKTTVSMVKSGSDYYLALDLVVVKAGTTSTGTDEGTEKPQEPEDPGLEDYGTHNGTTLTIRNGESLDGLAAAIQAARKDQKYVDTVDFTGYQGQIPTGILKETGVKKVVVNDNSQIQPDAFAGVGLVGKALTIEVRGHGQINQSILGGAEQVCLVLANATSVDEFAFQQWPQLTGVSLPQVGEIGLNAFLECTNLVNVYLGPAATVQAGAFSRCNQLRAIYYGGESKPSWNRAIGWQPTSISSFSDWNRAEAQKDEQYLVYGVPGTLQLADAWPNGFFQ